MEAITIDGTPGTAELQLGNAGDADNTRDGPGTAELQLGILHRCFRAAKILKPNPSFKSGAAEKP